MKLAEVIEALEFNDYQYTIQGMLSEVVVSP